jgi:2-methylcitrate dehydratase PrpD
MSRTIISQLADFAGGSSFAALPAAAVDECKRIVLDSLGCALPASTSRKGASASSTAA